jgi:uncharacterized repeat protein (TIGR01451 family)
MRILTCIAAVALLVQNPVFAQATGQAVTIVSKTQAVKEVVDAKGAKKRSLVDPTTVVPGQPLVFWLTYKNGGKVPATSFVINNPIPKSVDFTGFGEKSEWGVASVDGGKTFAPLATLKVMGADKKLRAATPKDVTNVRWIFAKPIAAGASGTVSFYGVVQ